VVSHLFYNAVPTGELMYHPLKNSMMTVNIELGDIWEEAIMTTFKTLFLNLHRVCKDYGDPCNNLSQDGCTPPGFKVVSLKCKSIATGLVKLLSPFYL
jgi:hypothetical protein